MRHHVSARTQTPRHRPWGLGTLLASAIVLLAACGAEVSSELELGEDASGARTLVATIIEEDLEYLDGGIEATEAALETHLPEQLTFQGISEASDADEEAAGASESYLAVFELEFSDIEDYRTKAQALIDLAAEKENASRDSSYGDITPKTVDIAFEQNDGPLLDGIILDENFSGTELLEWASYALVDEGVVDETDATSIISSTGSESRVMIGDEEYEISEPFTISEGTDHRFSNVSVTITDAGAEVELAAAFDYGDYDSGFAAAEQYLDETGVGSVSSTDEGYWTVTLDDSAALQEQLSELLGMDDLEIQVEETANPDNATLLTTLTGTGFSCAAACQSTPNISVDWSSDNILPVDEEVDGSTFRISYERAVRIDQVEVDTTVDLNGNVGQTYRFSVDSAQVDAFGEDLQAVFTPPEGSGSIDVETDDNTTVYVASLDATEPAALNNSLEEFLPGSSINVAGFDGIWPEYRVGVSAYGVEMFGVSPVQSIQLPVMHSANHDASSGINDDLTADSSDYTVVASGPTLTGLITLGIILVVVIAAIIVIVVFRKRIAASLRSAQTQAQTMAQSTSASWQAANQQRERSGAAPPQTDLLHDDAAWQTSFSESKLQ